MRVITPEKEYEIGSSNEYDEFVDEFSIFLAGTIDNGNSTDWQNDLIFGIRNEVPNNFIVYNPRRENWNINASEDEMNQQINWEQNNLENASLIVMVLLDESKSPISLMELGEFCKSQKIMVFCTKEFYRFQNVKDLCKRKFIPLYETMNIKEIKDKVIEVIKYNLN